MPHSHSITAACGVGYYGSGPEPVDTAPSAPRPFTLGEEPGWSYHEPVQPAEETTTPVVDQSDQSGGGEAGPLLGMGPGLSMDEQAVSVHCMWGLMERMTMLSSVPQVDGG